MGILAAILVIIINVLLFVFLFKKAKPTKESKPFVITSLVCGVIGMGVTTVLSLFLIALVAQLCSGCFEQVTNPDTGELVTKVKDIPSLIAYQAANNFIAVALVEEFAKSIFCLIGISIVKKVTKTKYLTNTFDAVFYFALSALAFGVIEDVGYVISSNIVAAGVRILTELSGHIFFGIIFGLFYAKREQIRATSDLSKEISEKNNIPNAFNKKTGGLLVLGFIVPVILHGIYDLFFQITPTIEAKYPGAAVTLYVIVIALIIVYTIACILLLRGAIKGNKEIKAVAEENCRVLYPEVEF